MIKEIYPISGMHCASCARTIEKILQKQPGVHDVLVNYGTEKVHLVYDEHKNNPSQLSAAISHLGYTLQGNNVPGISMTAQQMGMSESEHAQHLGLNQTKQEKMAELAELKKNTLVALPIAGVSIVVMGWEALSHYGLLPVLSDAWLEFIHHLLPIFATYILFVVGRSYLLGFYRFLRFRSANMDSLIGMGTLAAFLYSLAISAFEESLLPYLNVENSYYDVVIVVIAFITLGKYLEVRSKIKTGDAIEKLLNLQAKTALVLRGKKELELPMQQVVIGDLVVVRPGARIPVDGIVIEGSSYIDEAMVTGEPMPVAKNKGDAVRAGTINTTGNLVFRATKVGADTFLSQIIRMVEDAQGSRAPIQALADKISGVFVPIVIVIAFASLIAWLIFGISSLGLAQAVSYALTAFVGVLVIACPCALGLATPTAIIVGVGRGAENGILIKDAATLEKLYRAHTVVLDKTGTITRGKPTVTDILIFGDTKEKTALSLIASLDALSDHPVAQATASYAREQKIPLHKVSHYSALKGRGANGIIDKTGYYVGNVRLMRELGHVVDDQQIASYTRQGKTPVLLATKKEIIALVLVADSIKPDAKASIQALQKMGLVVVMMTGDDENTARFIADQVGISEFFAQVLPEDKLKHIQKIQKQGLLVVMVGDGINDAPALAQADVGIAMATGTDVAIATAGITLLHGDIKQLVKAVRLSHLTMRGIKQNLFWAFFYNIAGIPLAAGVLYPFFGILLNPIFAGMAMAFSSVSVVANSLRLKVKKL